MNLRNSAFAALSGILLASSFPTINFPLIAWIALIPLFLALSDQTGKIFFRLPKDGTINNKDLGKPDVRSGFWLGGISGLVYFAGTVHWVTNSVHFYGGIPIVPASLVTLLLCAYLAIYPALFGAAAVHLRNVRPRTFFIAAPALWTALELARTYVFSGFPWSLLGYSQYRALPVIQISDITGVYGVTFVIVLVNAAIAEFIMDRKRYSTIITAALIVAFVLGYGFVKLRNTPEKPDEILVTVIQGNIEQDKKWDPVYQAQTLAVYKELTREALKQRPDLVIWPETAVPFYFNSDGPIDRIMTADLSAFVKQNSIPLLFGSPTYEVKPNRSIYGRNSAFLLSANGRVEATYHKMHLVPFGEYVPLKSVLFFVDKMVQAIGDFQAGDEYTVMTIPHRHTETAVSTVICYEIIFPDLVRRFVDQGANVLTTVTNDAWFGRTAAPYQHFSMAVFRAVENRVPVARAANTGISGFIDAQGKILATSDIFIETQLTRAITPGTEKTFYTRYGDLFSYACLIASLILPATRPRVRLLKK